MWIALVTSPEISLGAPTAKHSCGRTSNRWVVMEPPAHSCITGYYTCSVILLPEVPSYVWLQSPSVAGPNRRPPSGLEFQNEAVPQRARPCVRLETLWISPYWDGPPPNCDWKRCDWPPCDKSAVQKSALLGRRAIMWPVEFFPNPARSGPLAQLLTANRARLRCELAVVYVYSAGCTGFP